VDALNQGHRHPHAVSSVQLVAWTVEDHLEGRAPNVRDLYQAFERLIAECGPYSVAVAKTAIAFKGTVRGFAGVTPRATSLAGFLDLMERHDEPPFTRAEPYTAKLWVHRFVVETVDQLDDRFAARVQDAYRVGEGAHRK
jgi:hypothetical protein